MTIILKIFILTLNLLTQPANAAHLNNSSLSSIGVFGPQGEVLVVEKNSALLKHLQVSIYGCEKNALTSEIESPAGCSLKLNTIKLTLTPDSFRQLLVATFKNLAQTKTLDTSDQSFLDLALVDDQAFAEQEKKLKQLKEQFERNQAYKKENPNDYDQTEETYLVGAIADLEKKVNSGPIAEAKIKFKHILDELAAAAEGKKLKLIVKASNKNQALLYKVLKSLNSAIVACDPKAMANATGGTLCHTSQHHLWQKTNDGNFIDLTNYMLVTPVLGQEQHTQALTNCSLKGLYLPSGYTNIIPKYTTHFNASD